MPSTLSEAEREDLVSGAPSDDYVNVVWLDEGSRFSLITFGSSSCPWVVTRLEAVDEGSIRLNLELEDAGACTDDLAPLTHELTLPPAVTERPVALQLTYSNWDSVTELVLN